MKFTRRQFVKGGVSAFTVGFAAPQFLTELAFAQGAPVAQPGGAVSRRRQRRAEHARSVSRRGVLQPPADAGDSRRQRAADRHRFVAASSSGCIRGSPDLKAIFDQGRLAIIQRTGYQNSSRSHFQGFDIWGTANPRQLAGHGLARALSRHAAVAGRSAGRLEHDARDAAPAHGADRRRAGDHQPGDLQLRQPEQRQRSDARAHGGDEDLVASAGRSAAPGVRQLHGAGARSARSTRWRRSPRTRRRVTYPNNGLGQALRAVAGAMNKQIGTKVFWVQTGGFDTHSGQGVNQGAYRQPDGDGQRQRARRSIRISATRGCSARRW